MYIPTNRVQNFNIIIFGRAIAEKRLKVMTSLFVTRFLESLIAERHFCK